MNYYNEFDPFAADWLRNLVAEGLIPKGVVDDRSIKEVSAADLMGFTQCHFFAGIAGWSLALQLAGWPSDREVWTGSCPCQPFSAAGKRQGTADDRHLWPEFFRLIRECQPATVFGEQVESAVRHGWLDGVFADLEGEGYACGAAVLGAHSVGAPHIRQRLWWVADAAGLRSAEHEYEARKRTNGSTKHAAERSGAGGLGDTGDSRLSPPEQQELCGAGRRGEGRAVEQSGGAFWSDFDLIPCRDGKARRIEPGSAPLAHGIPNRVGLLRGYGNSIVPQVAAEFITACMSTSADA